MQEFKIDAYSQQEISKKVRAVIYERGKKPHR